MKRLLYLIPLGFLIYLLGYWVGMKECGPHPAPDTPAIHVKRSKEWITHYVDRFGHLKAEKS